MKHTLVTLSTLSTKTWPDGLFTVCNSYQHSWVRSIPLLSLIQTSESLQHNMDSALDEDSEHMGNSSLENGYGKTGLESWRTGLEMWIDGGKWNSEGCWHQLLPLRMTLCVVGLTHKDSWLYLICRTSQVFFCGQENWAHGISSLWPSFLTSWILAKCGFFLFFISYGVFPLSAHAGVLSWSHVECFIASSHKYWGKPDASNSAQACSAQVCMPCSDTPFCCGESWTVGSWTVPLLSWCWINSFDRNSPTQSLCEMFMWLPDCVSMSASSHL